MDQQSIQKYILGLGGVSLGYLDKRKIAVFSLKDEDFAMIEVGKQPVRLSLRCDKRLSAILKEQYAEVMPGYKLNKNKWITIVLSGQLDLNQIEGLIDHSYQLIAGSL